MALAPARSADGPRILLVSNMWPSAVDPVFGIFVERHVSALREAGATVEVVANTDARGGAVAALGKYTRLALRAWTAGRPGAFDVVVGHYLYPTAAVARLAARRAKAPLVLVAHGTDVTSVQRGDVLARASRRALARADRVVTVSRALAALLTSAGLLKHAEDAAVVDMGVDTRVFAPDDSAREVLGVAADERIALFAGALTEGKGVDILIDAFFDRLGAGGPDRLVLVGSGPREAALRSRVAERAAGHAVVHAEDRVSFTGRLDAPVLAQWMAAADVFVLPSRAEGLGTVLLEAMACGTPCVGTSVGGIPEAIAAPACGELVSADDPVALADAVERVLATGKNAYADACRAQALAHSLESQARAMIAVVEEVAR